MYKKLSKEHRQKLSESKKRAGIIPPSRKGSTMPIDARLKIKLNNAKYWLGKKRPSPSTETKEKMRKSMIGKKHTEESKHKMSLSMTGIPHILARGENNHNWKGGITPMNHKIRSSIEIKLWREAVFARDNWTCQKYGTRGGKLHAHHIRNFANFPEFQTSIENGITLSINAHKEFHKKYGIKNNNRDQLNEFLKLETGFWANKE
mgnify:CR=1 FL=1